MSKQQKKYEKKSFESAGTPSDTSANIYMSMLMSVAWQSLTTSQRMLYVYCKAQYYAEKSAVKKKLFTAYGVAEPVDLGPYFTMNKSKWFSLYHLYSAASDKSFIRDMAALIGKGFVVCHYGGANRRHKNIYKLSDGWQIYGTSAFEVNPRDMTPAMRGQMRRYNGDE